MNALAVVLKPINYGWAVALTNGRELARFTGPRRNVVRWATRPAGTNAGRDHARRRRSAQARVFMLSGARSGACFRSWYRVA